MNDTMRFISIVSLFALLLFIYIKEHHEILTLRMHIPLMEKEIREIKEDNLQMEFTLREFLNSHHLIQLARDPTYSHLVYPKENEIIKITP